MDARAAAAAQDTLLFSGLGVLSIAATALVILIIALWIILPFAVFGTKTLIREAIDELRTNNKLLEAIREGQREQSAVRMKAGSISEAAVVRTANQQTADIAEALARLRNGPKS